jgi:hypothetical protein
MSYGVIKNDNLICFKKCLEAGYESGYYNGTKQDKNVCVCNKYDESYFEIKGSELDE